MGVLSSLPLLLLNLSFTKRVEWKIHVKKGVFNTSLQFAERKCGLVSEFGLLEIEKESETCVRVSQVKQKRRRERESV